MSGIYLRPELVTSNGEACGIMFDEHYVGSLTLIYREEDRMYGSVQLDQDFLKLEEKDEIDHFVHRYVQNKINALGVPDCLVTVTYSEYDYVVATDIDNEDEYDMLDMEEEENIHLTIVGESRNKVEYQLLNKSNELIAEVLLDIHRGDVNGDIYWHEEPSDEQIDEVANIIVSDFDSDLFDTFAFHMIYDNEEIVTIELNHYDMLDDDIEEDQDIEENIDDEELYVDVYEDEDTRLHFELIRDDIDTLTLDVYEEEDQRDSRLGTITINMDEEEITALVDFINPRDRSVREQLAYQLIEELESELDFETLTVSMQYNDEVIDEFVFDVHDQEELQPC